MSHRPYPPVSRSRRLVHSWHPTKNGDLRPRDLTQGSGRYVWWRCAEGPDHEWRAMVASRARGCGCPFCANQRASITNCLATRAPEIADLWDRLKNGRLSPLHVMPHSRVSVWWKCSLGPDHEWRAPVHSVRFGCPFCRGLSQAPSTALAKLAPDIAAEWHPHRNGTVRPEDVHVAASRIVWWKCPAGSDHEWRQSVRDRTRGRRRCPFCHGQRMCRDKSLAARFPDLARQWHPRKNGARKPEQLFWASHVRVWWKCAAGRDHEWSTKCYQRTRAKSGCPFCSGRLASVTNSLATLFPKVAALWHPTRNGTATPHDVRPGTSRAKYWWQCPCGQEFSTWPMTMTRGRPRCPACRRDLNPNR